MTEILEFPTFSVSEQLFYVGGQARSGGVTSGGANILSPEPGGFSALELTPSLVTTEWKSPLMSWVMSNLDGAVFRVRLAATPQCLTGVDPWVPSSLTDGVPWDTDTPWDGGALWDVDFVGLFTTTALKSSNTVTFTIPSGVDREIERGIAIGHKNRTYLIHSFTMLDASTVQAVVKPPLRENIAVDDIVYFKPFFLGTISNGAEFRTGYKRALMGSIEPNRILFSEAIV